MIAIPGYDDVLESFKVEELSDLHRLTNGAIYPTTRLTSILLLLTYVEDKSLVQSSIASNNGVNQTYYYFDPILDKPVITGVYDLSCIGEDVIIFISSHDGFNSIDFHYQFDKSDNSLISLSLEYNKESEDFDYVTKLLQQQVLFKKPLRSNTHEH